MKSNSISQMLAKVCLGMMFLSVASCEKMKVENLGDDGHRANVYLRVGSIGQVPFDVVTRAVAPEEVCTRLNFLIYDDTGTRIRQESQVIGDDSFGQASFFIPKGHYLLTILAHSSNGNPTSTNPQRIGFTNKTGFTDTFLYSDSLIVGDADMEKTLELKRIVAMVRFVPDDAVPAKADSIRFYYTGGSGTLDATSGGWGAVNSTQSQWYRLNHDERKFEIYTIPHDEDGDLLKVEVNTYAASGVLVSEKKIEGIPVKRNHITTCRGYLFTPVYGMDFRISIDDKWDTDSINFVF